MIKLSTLSIAAVMAAGLPYGDIVRSAPQDARDAGPPETACQAGFDSLDDLASNPAARLGLSSATTRRLMQGIVLCRASRTEEGAAMLRQALPIIRRID